MKTPTTDMIRRNRFFGLTVSVFAACLCARGALVINEVCYDNSTLPDENGDTSSDWVELYNTGPAAVNILNYGLGDANGYEERLLQNPPDAAPDGLRPGRFVS